MDRRVRALTCREQLFETRPPSLWVMRRRGELGAGGAAACGEVEALGVEPDRPPAPGTRSPGGGFVSREAREQGRAKGVRLGEEPLLGLGQRGFAVARDEDLGHGKRGGPAEAAVEMHVVDPELVQGEIGEAGIEASLGIAL